MIESLFSYDAPSDLVDALELLNSRPGSVVLAGGTDLVGQMKRNLIRPDRVVSLSHIASLQEFGPSGNDGYEIGACATLAEIASDISILRDYPALATAAGSVATPQIRNTGTVGGNMLQAPRCMYYRHPVFSCARTGGVSCLAVSGRNRYSALIPNGVCHTAHPSDLMPALIALDAHVDIAGIDGPRTIACEDLHKRPAAPDWQDTVLQRGELITRIVLPKPPDRSVYVKYAERRSIDFAQVSIAVSIEMDGPTIAGARMVCGGVSPVPYRLSRVEHVLVGQPLAAPVIDAAANALPPIKPLTENGYKIDLLKEGIVKSLSDLIIPAE